MVCADGWWIVEDTDATAVARRAPVSGEVCQPRDDVLQGLREGIPHRDAGSFSCRPTGYSYYWRLMLISRARQLWKAHWRPGLENVALSSVPASFHPTF